MGCPTYPYHTLHDETLAYITGYVHSRTGIPISVLMAQVLDETGGLTSAVWYSCHNPAGIEGGSCGGPYAFYATYVEAAQGYADTYMGGYYNNVLALARSGASIQALCVAIGDSPWAGSHYVGSNGEPGGALYEIIQCNDLTQFDSVSGSSSTTPYTGTTTGVHRSDGGYGSTSGSGVPFNPGYPTCTKYGSFIGEGAAADVRSGLYVFAETVNGVTIKTATDQTCQLVGQWVHGAPKPVNVVSVTTKSVKQTIVQTLSNPNNLALLGLGLALGLTGFYYLEHQHGIRLLPSRRGAS